MSQELLSTAASPWKILWGRIGTRYKYKRRYLGPSLRKQVLNFKQVLKSTNATKINDLQKRCSIYSTYPFAASLNELWLRSTEALKELCNSKCRRSPLTLMGLFVYLKPSAS